MGDLDLLEQLAIDARGVDGDDVDGEVETLDRRRRLLHQGGVEPVGDGRVDPERIGPQRLGDLLSGRGRHRATSFLRERIPRTIATVTAAIPPPVMRPNAAPATAEPGL